MNTKGDSNATEPKMETIIQKVGFIGAGNMAKAIGEGLLKSGIISASQIYVSAPSMRNLTTWKTLGANVTQQNSDIVKSCEIIILAVKPQYVTEAITSSFEGFTTSSDVTLVSILAGISIASIKTMLADTVSAPELDRINVVRAMPNTPLLVGEGCTILSIPEDQFSDSKKKEVLTKHQNIIKFIFSVNGLCMEVNENLINPMSALSGSGPAYIYQIIEALSDGAVKIGVPRNTSYTLAAQTVLGAAKMVLTTGQHPGALKDEVCSPGGTTIAGISAMERNGVRYGLIQAIEAAHQRSEEIAAQTKKQ